MLRIVSRTWQHFGVKAKKQLETVAYLKANKGSESRVAYQSRRWRIARLVQGFVQGQFETGFAGVLAKAVNAMYDEKHAGKSQERSGLEFVSKVDISVNMAWTDCAKVRPAVWTQMDKLPFKFEEFEKNDARLKAKVDELTKNLRDAPRWKGAMGEVDGALHHRRLWRHGQTSCLLHRRWQALDSRHAPASKKVICEILSTSWSPINSALHGRQLDSCLDTDRQCLDQGHNL